MKQVLNRFRIKWCLSSYLISSRQIIAHPIRASPGRFDNSDEGLWTARGSGPGPPGWYGPSRRLHYPVNVKISNFNSYIYKIRGVEKLLNNLFGHNVEQPSLWLDVSRTLRWPTKTFVYPWRRLMKTSHDQCITLESNAGKIWRRWHLLL